MTHFGGVEDDAADIETMTSNHVGRRSYFPIVATEKSFEKYGGAISIILRAYCPHRRDGSITNIAANASNTAYDD